MTDILIQLLHSKAGAFVQWLAGLFIGWLAAQIVALGIEIPADAYLQLQTALAGFGAFLVTFAVQWYQAKQAAKLQITAGVKPDSWIGEETLKVIEDLAKK